MNTTMLTHIKSGYYCVFLSLSNIKNLSQTLSVFSCTSVIYLRSKMLQISFSLVAGKLQIIFYIIFFVK